MTTAFVSHPDCLRHAAYPGHPERPARLNAIQDRLIADGLWDYLSHHPAPLATLAQLARVHDRRYVNRLLALAPTNGLRVLDPDTVMNPFTVTAARRAAGAAVLAAELVVRQHADNAFCSVRPPGHHAEPERAAGFCFFNNLAVGVAHALNALGLERVAIADFDAHYGNGTEQIFANDRRVMICSVYQHPLYPFIEGQNVPDSRVHVALPPGTQGPAFRAAVSQRWLPALQTFRPAMLFISAGFDGHAEDRLTHWSLLDEDYAWVTEQLLGLAKRHAGGRIVSILEGGYALPALGRSVAAHVRALMGLDI